MTPNKILAIAAKEIGYKESPPHSNNNKFGRWYGMDSQPWCAMFVSYCFYTGGLPLKITTNKGFSYCPYGVKWFSNNNKFFKTPKVGDIVFYDWERDGVSDHVGIVEKITANNSVIAIEGNTSSSNFNNGGQVMRVQRSLRIVPGFGRPDYLDSNIDIELDYSAWPGRYITLTTPYTKGGDVKKWQQRMIELGYDLGSYGADGIFGEISYQALLQLQQDTNLIVDGILGNQSWYAAFMA